MKVLLAVLAAAILAGCSVLSPADRYVPGENFGDGGATRCGYRTTLNADSTLPPCN